MTHKVSLLHKHATLMHKPNQSSASKRTLYRRYPENARDSVTASGKPSGTATTRMVTPVIINKGRIWCNSKQRTQNARCTCNEERDELSRVLLRAPLAAATELGCSPHDDHDNYSYSSNQSTSFSDQQSNAVQLGCKYRPAAGLREQRSNERCQKAQKQLSKSLPNTSSLSALGFAADWRGSTTGTASLYSAAFASASCGSSTADA